MKPLYQASSFLLLSLLIGCTGKTKDINQVQDKPQKVLVDGPCEDCTLIYQGMPEHITAIDTSAGWKEPGQKLVVEGTVWKPDGKTPAPGVIVYYWQTDHTGEYTKTAEEKTVHGHLRGWMKSDLSGNYKIYTVKPVSYPSSTIPAHIHFLIKEPDIANEYYIEDLLFDDDRFLTESVRAKLQQRGGNGIGKTRTENGITYIRRDIIVGLNIPKYPK
ncbi:intradiol ring-cleavage dioxygenase [Flavobacterium sp.]|uniref:dioxygenase family protein n=1 Tax=Flavobacterium sp. TaxID=239 RepID=UPI003D6AC35C